MKEFIFLLKNYLFRHKAYKKYKESLYQLSLDPTSLTEINWRKRKMLIEFAYENIKFYREYYDKYKFHPSQLKEPLDWGKVPFIEKKHIKENFDAFINENAASSRLRSSTTGGSTGEPLKIYRDKFFPEEILQWRLFNIWKLPLGSDIAMVWRIPKSSATPRQKLLNYLIWWPTKRIKLDASYLNEDKIEKFIKECDKSKPPILYGYTGALEEITRFAKKKELLSWMPKVIWSTAAPLSNSQYNLFKSTFNSEIIDQYACSEVFYIAANCPKNNNLHYNIDYRHIDIIDKTNTPVKGTNLGEIAITDLENYVFPLIKYKTGDISSFIYDECSCKLNLPLISPVKGRVSDKLFLPEGGTITGEYLTTVFDDYHDLIDKFQIRQKEDFSIEISIIPKNRNNDMNEIGMQIINKLKSMTKNALQIQVLIVKNIPSIKGKSSFIINDLLKKNSVQQNQS